ncbi:MAG TPA: S8 family serine peptidase, partial [Hanamia sp.]|nr:S8 family serine peptidase [Hanamia sp.]
MKKNLLHRIAVQWIACLFIAFQIPGVSHAQNLKISDFVLFSSGQTTIGSGCSFHRESTSSIKGGAVGSYSLVKTNTNAVFVGNINSGGTVQLDNYNKVTGNITSAASLSNGAAIDIGKSAVITGNIDANGNIKIQSGSVNGTITHPQTASYSGPKPSGGNISGTPSLPVLPELPTITKFGNMGTTDISTSKSISAGDYGNLTLKGNQTITLLGTGVYSFKAIKNGGSNTFIFDFKNDPSGTFKIYVFGDVDLNLINAKMINGGSASRIYSETHGSGSTCSRGKYAWDMANGTWGSKGFSKWLGTVWAPYGGINIGSGSETNCYTGAFYSGTFINVQNNVKIIYEPFVQCSTPVANAGVDKVLDCSNATVQLDGTPSTPGLQYSWTAVDNGQVLSGETTLTPTVDAVGNYVLTVTDPTGGCSATDTVLVTFSRCILPYYPPPEGGKIRNLIGAELNSLAENFGFVSDSAQNIFILMHDSVMIEVIALKDQYQALVSLLQTAPYGMTDLINNGPNSLIITGKYPIKNLLKLDSLPNLIDYCRPLFPSIGNAGIVTSQGDTAMRSNFVRQGYDVSGEGIKIGVLSNSYNTIPGNPAQTDVINGDLPGIGNPDNPTPVQVLKEYPFGRLSDEGRAMLQVVHDIAPKSTLAFRTGFISSGDFAQGIKEMQQSGCNIIVDDITYITEPFFQDGIIAQAVDSAAAKGVAYFSAAGNYGSQSYEGIFNPATAPKGINGVAHNFGNGDIYQTITLTPGTYTAVLQWQDDIYSNGQTETGTANDLDIFLTDNNGNALFGFNRNNIGGDPIEVLPFTVTENTQTNIIIVRAAGTGNVRFKYVFFRGNGIVSKYNSNTSTIVGQANAAGAMAVGAVLYSNTPAHGVNPPTIASFSSTGGTPVNGVVRQKPEFTAPNGVNTTVALGGQNIDGDAFPNFFGTSCAAPHAAGVAALIMEAKKKYANQIINGDSVRSLLERTALDMGTPGFDFISGYGFIQADVALRTFATPKPLIVKLVLPDSTIKPGTAPINITVQGNFLDPASTVLFRGEPLPTTPINATEAKVTIPSFIGNPPIQVYTAPLSSSGLDG